MVVRRVVNRNAQLLQKEVLRNPLTGWTAVKRTRKKKCAHVSSDLMMRHSELEKKPCSAPAPFVCRSDIDPTASLLTPTRTSHSIFLLPLLCLKTKKRGQFEADPLWKTKVSYPRPKESVHETKSSDKTNVSNFYGLIQSMA